MSLKVWLPLNGDLKNLGASGTEIISNGVTVDINGKIGSCYSFSPDNSSYLRLNTAPFNNNTTEFSFTCWFKPNTSHIGCLFSNRSSTTSAGISLWYYNSVFYFDAGDRWSSVSNANATIGAWNHLAFTWKLNGKKRIYVNGNIVGEENAITALTSATIGTAFIGAAQTTANHDTVPGGSYFNGYLNDVRIYDHCLSAAEVHEIAMGLIAHYKLDDANPNPNLLPDSDAPSLTKVYGNYNRYWEGSSGTNYTNTFEPIEDPPAPGLQYMVRHTRTSEANFHSMVWYSGGTIALTIGNTYTMSCYAKVVSGTDLRICFEIGSGTYANTNVTITNDNEWHQYSWTFTPTSDTAPNGATRIYCGGLRSVGTVLLCGYKLEEGNTATPWIPYESEPLHKVLYHTQIEDSSGYNHFATTSSILTATSNTPRYSAAMTFNGTNYGDIHDVIFGSDHLASELTWAGWIKREFNDNVTGRRIYYGIIDVFLYTDNNLRFRWVHSNIDYSYSTTNTWEPGIIIPHNSWTHIALTFKDGDLKIYINGEYMGHSDRTGNGQYIRTHISHYLGASSDTTNQWIGDISDIRIYTTALLDNDIKLLYNMGMKVDNLGRVHTFEFNENTNEKLLKTGILQSNELEETSAQLAKLKENKGWLSPNFIEI